MRNWRDENGQVLVMVALSMTVLLGFVAFATDVGVMLRERRIVQSAADAAAIGAATEALWENTPSSVTSGMWSAATKDATLNGFTPGSTNGSRSSNGSLLTINITPNISISGYNASGYVQAIAAQTTPTMFMNLFGFHSMDVTATAIASHKVTSNGCIYVLDNGGNDTTDTVDMNGNSLIASPNCAMTVNGTINTGGSSSIDTKFTYASTTDVQPDPLSYLQETANQPTLNGLLGLVTTGCSAPSGSGMLCLYDMNDVNGVLTTCALSSTCTLSGTLQSNTVFYYDKPVVVAQNSATTGDQDTIYLTGSATSSAPYLDFYNGGLKLTPPGLPLASAPTPPGSLPSLTCTKDSNPLCGIVLDAPTDGLTGGTYTCKSGSGNNSGNPGAIYLDFGSSTTDLYGILYAPAMQLFVQDEGSNTYLYTNLVIGNICSQSATINLVGFSGNNSPNVRTGLVY